MTHDPKASAPDANPANAPQPPSSPADEAAPYEPPKLTRLGTLLELTGSGRGARIEAFRGSR